jgi:copper(I)-binding protein
MRLVLPFATALTLTLISAVSFARGAEVAVGHIVVTAAWARATPPGAKVGVAYLTIENRGSEEVRLRGATVDAASSASIHETIEENGIAKMHPVSDLAVAAGASLEMRPGGLHLMLMDLHAPIKQGDDLSITLEFANAGRVTVPLQVAPIGAAGPDPHSGH